MFGQMPKSSSKVLFKLDFFSWCPLLLCYVLKYEISSSGRSLAKIVETTCDRKIRSNIFIVDKICKKRTYNIGRFKIMKHVHM